MELAQESSDTVTSTAVVVSGRGVGTVTAAGTPELDKVKFSTLDGPTRILVLGPSP